MGKQDIPASETTYLEQGVIKVMPFDVLYRLTLGVAVGLAKR